MNETLITDLVAQQALDQLEELDRKMEGTLTQFQDCARELARGIKIPVEVTGDLERLRELANTTMQRAGQAAQQYTQQLQQQQQVIANTTNTISRQLMEQERLNKAQREAFTQQQQALDIADRILGSHEQNVRALAKYTQQLEQLKAQRKAGAITSEEYIRRELELKAAKQEVQRILVNESKMNQSAAGSYQHLSLQLERLKMAQKQLNEEEKRGEEGKALEKEIQELDAHLKDLAADMGEFQRNVGNYAVAANNMKGTLRQLTEEIAQLTLKYEELSDDEKRSDVGMQMRDKITQLTEEAGKYKDIVADVKQSINASASDTRLFDSLIEGGELFASTMGVAETACRALGMSEDTLQESMLKVQQAMQAVQALQVIQNTLQKQSNLMKGIAILQSKAAAAAAKMEAAATASATGATKAQTVAQAAFNLVAKANPYVLLATAILAVIGLVVGYTAATKDATKADEEAKKAAEERKESMDSMAQSFGNTAGEMIAKYKVMREQWNALGDDISSKRKYLVQHKSDFETLAKSAGKSADSVGSVHAVEKNYMNNTTNVVKAIKRRAKAMAGYAEYIRITQLKLQELEKLSTFKYRIYKEGDRVDNAVFEKAGLTKNEDQLQASRYSGYGGGIRENTTWLTAEQADQMTAWSREQGNKAALEAMDRVTKKYDEMAERAWKHFVNNGGLEPANFAGGGGSVGGGGGKSTPGKGGGNNAQQVKSAEDIQNELNSILLSGYTYASELEEKYTAEWLASEKKRIERKRDNDIAAAKKKSEALKEDIKASKMSEEEKQKAKAKVEAATADIIKGINHQATEEEKKLDNEILEHKQQLAQKEIDKALSKGEAEQVMRDAQYANELEALKEKYAKELAEVEGNEEKISEIKKRYQEQTARLSEQYAIKTAQAQYDLLIKQLEAIGAVDEDMIVELTEMVKNGELDAAATILEAYGLTHDEAIGLLKSLADAEIGIRTATTDAVVAQIERESEANKEAAQKEKDAHQKKMQNLQEWVQNAGEAMQKIGEFISAMYDNQISKIEELLEEEQERYEQEVEHIDYLAEHGAITEEEAEIRKRDAAAATAAKQEQLEKKKAQIEYKKALMEKANSIAQIGIATALGIMQALAMWPPNIPLAAFVGAMGAIQVATALAQPIKAYAEGTKGKKHPGGLALVGDGNKAEVVMYDGKAWVTPDSPTLVDLPKGAEVLPDAEKVSIMGAVANIPRDRVTGAPIIINDYSALESRVATNTKAVTKALRDHQNALTRQLKRQKFDAYIARRI